MQVILKNFTPVVVLLIALFVVSPTVIRKASAANGSSIQIQSVEFSDEQPTPTPQVVKQPTPENKPLFTVSKEYPVSAKNTLQLFLSDRLIDFGQLSPSNPINRALSIKFNNASLPTSGVFAWEDHPLEQPNGSVIPDTTCDNGSCSESIAAPWTSELTYGFGYRCELSDGTSCLSQDTEPTTYKQFSNYSASEPFALITQAKESKIVFQVNTAGAQQDGVYTTSITLVANPGF